MATVVIFGRPNVGKSTLFNKLTEKKYAMVSPVEGTTRDSNTKKIEWRRHIITLVDTGGILDIREAKKKKAVSGEETELKLLDRKVQKQAYDFVKKADLVLFLLDSKTGIMPQDNELATAIKRLGAQEKTILVANKAENAKDREFAASEFYKINLGDPVCVSAASGSGTGDLLDLIVDKIQNKNIDSYYNKNIIEQESEQMSAVLAGQPNVGKSSLLNAIMNQEKVIVSPIPHTTREPHEEVIESGGINFFMVDTAGISHKGAQEARLEHGLEGVGIAKTLKAIGKAEIVLLVIDISKRISRQDLRIAEEILDRKKSLIIIANKWDLIPEKDQKKYLIYIRAKFAFAAWAPVLFVSAKTKSKTEKIISLVLEVAEKRKKKISEEDTKNFIQKIAAAHRPTRDKHTTLAPRFRSLKQSFVNPPEFELRIGSRESLSDNYIRFLENRIRKDFDFLGTPVKVKIKK